MDNKQTLRVFIYIRVSTLEQAREGYSIHVQEERLRAYAKARGYTIVKVYTDPGYSGANLNRPALQEMVKQIEQGVADLVLVYKLDRLSRSQRDTLHLIEEVFLKNEVDFVSMNESFDTSTPFGRAMIGILSVFAQLEREQIRERSMMGREARAKEGKWHGGGGIDRIVTGYDYLDGRLFINDFEASCVKYIFKRYLEGHGITKIHGEISSKFPGVIAAETTVRNIIQNPLYIGKIKYNDEVYEGIHDPLISERDFNLAQEFMKKRASSSQPFRKSYLLTGVLFCGLCGARMFGRTGGRLKNGDPMKYYTCYSRHGSPERMVKDKNCIKSNDRKEKLEDKVVGEIKKLNMRTLNGHKAEDETPKDIALLEGKIEEIDKQLSKLIDLYSLDDSPIDLISEKIESLKRDKDGLRSHMKELQNVKQEDNSDEIKKAVSQLSTFEWDNEETDKKRLLVAKLINKIIVSNDNITIEWAF